MKVLQAKVFSYCTTNISPPGELQINAWLAERPDIEIVQMLQSESMVAVDHRIETNLTITLVYRGEPEPKVDAPSEGDPSIEAMLTERSDGRAV